MIKKKCGSCAKKVSKSYNYCPYCGASFKARKESEDYGLLGRDDDFSSNENEISLPFGMGKIVNTLVKQLEKELSSMDMQGNGGKVPKGFKIQVSTGRPPSKSNSSPKVVNQNNQNNFVEPITKEEMIRRNELPKEEAESKVRRLSDRIIYEISVPEISSKRDVVITRLASGFEVKAYSKKKCYTKFIPLNSDFLGHYVSDDKVFVELKA